LAGECNLKLEKNPFLAIPVPIYIGAGMADRRVIDGFSKISILFE